MSSFTQLSPGVNVREIDLTNIIPNVGASGGAFVGQFAWGPAYKRTVLSDAIELQEQYGKPNDTNFVDWFSAADFLAYTGNLTLVRAVDENALNATDDGTGILIENETHFEVVSSSPTGVRFAAKYPGALGNSIAVHMSDAATFSGWEYEDQFDFAPGTSEFAAALGASNDEVHIVVVDAHGLFTGVVGAILERYAFVSKSSDAKDANNAPNYYVSVLNRNSRYVWALEPIGAPDTTNVVSGGTVSEITVTNGGSGYTTATVSIAAPSPGGVQATATATIVGGEITAIEITNPGSGYTSAPTITITGDGTGADATATIDPQVTNAGTAWGLPCISSSGVISEYAMLVSPIASQLSGGADSTAVSAQELIRGYAMFENAEEVDVSLIFLGDAGGEASHTAVTQYVIDNICERRRDCMVFFSPTLNDVLNKTQGDAAQACVARRNKVGRSSSFAVMDTGWKLRYDVFNDKMRWIPLNADVAGLCARVDNTNDPWWSPAGYTRGRIKNVVSLAFNPNKTSRDIVYKVGINPVVTFNVDGTVLYGDRTLQGKNSAFSWIGTRRLFILLQKAISNAAKYSLFEFNDRFTRAAFVNMVEPYLREVKGRRGMDSYMIQCDSTNNTPEVIMRGEFVGSIYIKPQYSIQWITLNFVAVRRDVAFEEVVGVI